MSERAPVTRMTQQALPFDAKFEPGWTGRRFLICVDGKWHLVLEIKEGRAAETQCGADTKVTHKPTTDAKSFPMCDDCSEAWTSKNTRKR